MKFSLPLILISSLFLVASCQAFLNNIRLLTKKTTTTTTANKRLPGLFAQLKNNEGESNHKNPYWMAISLATALALGSSSSIVWPEAVAAAAVTATKASTVPVTVLNHDYSDPFHPLCKRKIQVSTDDTGKTMFHYSGTAVGPKDDPVLRGCSKEEIAAYTLRRGAFDGTVTINKENGMPAISAGDGIHEGVWEPKISVNNNDDDDNLRKYSDVDGIRWNDGNKWIVLEQSYVQKNADGKNFVVKKPTKIVAGEFIFYSYIGVSTLAGIKGVFEGIDMRQKKEAL